MARADPRRVLAAQLTGIAAGVAHTRRCTAEEGLAEVERELVGAKVKPGSPQALLVLTMAAGLYATDQPAIEEWWYPEAFAFLVRAGADEAAARASRRG